MDVFDKEYRDNYFIFFSASHANVSMSVLFSFSSSTPQTSVSQSSSSAAAIIPPPPDIQPVIDKLAEYVARNGVKFESSVHAKNDPRYAS